MRHFLASTSCLEGMYFYRCDHQKVETGNEFPIEMGIEMGRATGLLFETHYPLSIFHCGCHACASEPYRASFSAPLAAWAARARSATARRSTPSSSTHAPIASRRKSRPWQGSRCRPTAHRRGSREVGPCHSVGGWACQTRGAAATRCRRPASCSAFQARTLTPPRSITPTA